MKYESDLSGWCTKEVQGPQGASLWRSLRRKWVLFAQYIQYEVGDGTRHMVWG